MVTPVLAPVALPSSQQSVWVASILRAALEMALLFSGAVVTGFAVLVGLFKMGAIGHVEIIFYRGVVLCSVAAFVLGGLIIALGRWRPAVTVRDAIAAACLSFGLNLSFLVIAPVTVDRSISVFMIATMAAAPERSMSTTDMDQAFRAQYLDRMAQIDRRMKEQVISGTIVEDGGRYRITQKGLRFMHTARLVAWMFDTDMKLLDQPPAPLKAK
jgi:hypothetical protein